MLKRSSCRFLLQIKKSINRFNNQKIESTKGIDKIMKLENNHNRKNLDGDNTMSNVSELEQ